MTHRPDDPHDLEGTVDRLEEKVLGHRVDQRREEGDEPSPAHEDDVEPGEAVDEGPGAEPVD